MAACSSGSPPQRSEPTGRSTSTCIPKHVIFLSHSGYQKPFVKALYERLHPHYSTFLDITQHSLPLAEKFPPHIFHAAQTCLLAVVVLSEEYVQSKWPMLELCQFLQTTPPPKILPLFYKLHPNDLKKDGNLDRWHATWQKLEEENPSRVNAFLWKKSLKDLFSYNGIRIEDSEEESAYIERVFFDICGTLPSSMRHDFSGFQGMDHRSKTILAKFEALDISRSKVCVLGLYGLPGSGKTSLCRYLCDCQFTEFRGKAFHLELSMYAEDEELLIKFKALLGQLTNFNNKMELSEVSSILQAYRLLSSTDVANSRVFLIVDNVVSENSRRFVEELLLRLNVAAGSRILLVARSIDALHPILPKDGIYHNIHYVCDSMIVPYLTTPEAVQILLQYKDDVGLKNSYAQEAVLTSSDRKIIEEVVQESGFQGEDGHMIYLPLILERMGRELREGKRDVESWSKTMKRLCKKDALKQILKEGFKTLPRRCRTLFLDVALFIIPLWFVNNDLWTMDGICSYLSYFHDCEPERIERELEELQRQGFLTIHRERWFTVPIEVHDLYLEYAASIETAAAYYSNRSLGGMDGGNERHRHISAAGSAGILLRTAVLKLDESTQCFQISLEFSRVKAMIFRECLSLDTLRVHADLTCIMHLEVYDCPYLRWLEPLKNREWPHIQRFQWINKWILLGKTPHKQHRRKYKRSLVPVDQLLTVMKGLVILRLVNTDITRDLDISCVPQLRELEVSEYIVRYLRVCNLPSLERLVFMGDAIQLPSPSQSFEDEMFEITYDACVYHAPYFLQDAEPVVVRKGFLAGCPRLQLLYMRCVAFEDEWQDIMLASSHLERLKIVYDSNVPKCVKLRSAAASLQKLCLDSCPELRSLKFECVYGKLIWLALGNCMYVTEVRGLENLPNLETLVICSCCKLKRVSGLADLDNLERVFVDTWAYNLQRFFLPDFENMTQARGDSDDSDDSEDVASLIDWVSVQRTSVSEKGIYFMQCDWQDLEECFTFGELMDSSGSDLVEMAQHIKNVASQDSLEHIPSVETLRIQRLVTLKMLKGIEHLSSISCLLLNSLPHLSCLQGIEELKVLEQLFLWNCRSVEEMPSLSTLAHLEEVSFRNCKRLKTVEGCEKSRPFHVQFYKCEKLSKFPLDLENGIDFVDTLDIRGSKFAGVETLVAWAENEETPKVLRRASLKALQWKLSRTVATNQVQARLQKKIRKILAERGVESACNRGNDVDHVNDNDLEEEKNDDDHADHDDDYEVESDDYDAESDDYDEEETDDDDDYEEEESDSHHTKSDDYDEEEKNDDVHEEESNGHHTKSDDYEEEEENNDDDYENHADYDDDYEEESDDHYTEMSDDYIETVNYDTNIM